MFHLEVQKIKVRRVPFRKLHRVLKIKELHRIHLSIKLYRARTLTISHKMIKEK